MASKKAHIKFPMHTSLLNPSFGIPTDVTFVIMGFQHLQLDNSEETEIKLGEVKGHKLILGLFSTVFKSEFFGPVKDTKDTIPVRETTIEAFENMFDFIYSKETDWTNLTVLELYDIVNLAEKYDIPGLMEELKNHMDNIPLTMGNVMDVADTAYQFNQFPDFSSSLLLQCAKFINNTLKTPASLLKFASDQSGLGQEATVLKLIALINHEHPIQCQNCKETPCQHGQPIAKTAKFTPGCKLVVNKLCAYWGTNGGNYAAYEFTVISVNPNNVNVKVNTSGTTSPPEHLMIYCNIPTFCYMCV